MSRRAEDAAGQGLPLDPPIALTPEQIEGVAAGTAILAVATLAPNALILRGGIRYLSALSKEQFQGNQLVNQGF